MQVTINGERHALTAPLNLGALLKKLGLDERKVAIERNLQIVPHSIYGQTGLQDGDHIEIVHFIGGG